MTFGEAKAIRAEIVRRCKLADRARRISSDVMRWVRNEQDYALVALYGRNARPTKDNETLELNPEQERLMLRAKALMEDAGNG